MHKHEAGVSRFFIYTVSALYKISGTGCNKYKTRHTNISTPSRTPRSTVGSYAPTVARNSYHLRAPRDHIQSIDPPANRPGNTRLGSRASGSTRAPRPMTRPRNCRRAARAVRHRTCPPLAAAASAAWSHIRIKHPIIPHAPWRPDRRISDLVHRIAPQDQLIRKSHASLQQARATRIDTGHTDIESKTYTARVNRHSRSHPAQFPHPHTSARPQSTYSAACVPWPVSRYSRDDVMHAAIAAPGSPWAAWQRDP